MKPPLRIAILECDTPLTQTNTKYGGYCGVFTVLLKAGAEGLGQDDMGEDVLSSKAGLDISHYDVVSGMDYPELDNIDAVLLTGSQHNSFDDDPWILRLVDFTKKVLAQDRVRVIGVCFGHQIVGRALGAKVGRSDKSWEISVSLVKTTEKGRELFGCGDIMSIHQMHRDIVFTYPEGVESLGTSPACEVQGMYIRKRLISVQGHPEFTEEIVRELLGSRHDRGIFDDGQFRDAMDRVGNSHDGVRIASGFLRFLLEE